MINFLRHGQGKGCERKPFSRIPPYYDRLMKDVDYEQWARYIGDLVKRADLPADCELLDLGCGTGTFSILLAKAGFAVCGIDSSPEMLKIAKDKAAKSRVKVRFHEGALRSFTAKKPYRAAVSLFDSVNYILSNRELEESFRQVYKALEPGGIFLFDINSVYALSEFWNGRLEVREDGGITSIWEHRYDVGDSQAELHLTLFVPQGRRYKKLVEIHRERAYELIEIETLLAKAGFTKSEMFKHGTFESPLANTTRIMVVAYK
ncbi:MAG: class I SAM-dependent methyltransferase [Candidatus Edwardsbacteria bacterium]|nr:class I SAM-dependent methyltransferase [Candidatus Edwardsbacteria bacterium]